MPQFLFGIDSGKDQANPNSLSLPPLDFKPCRRGK